jgi:hypothetical protein
VAESRFAKLGCPFEHCVENWLQFPWRTRNDSQNIRGSRHPHATAQQVNKHEAQNGLERLYRRFPELVTHAINALQQIIDVPSLPSDHPDANAVEKEKRRARITLALWTEYSKRKG